MELKSQIEGLLFSLAEPVALDKLPSLLKVSRPEIEAAINELKTDLEGRGIRLVVTDDEVALGTSPELGSLIEKLRKDELSKELTKASLETLSVIVYKNGATRSEIDYIRGVNSSFILRNLSVRGLIAREVDAKDSRRYVYKPTLELLSYLGSPELSMLPEYEKYHSMLTTELGSSVIKENNEDTE